MIQDILARENRRRNEQASIYNSYAGAYNRGLQPFRSTASNIGSQISGLQLGQFDLPELDEYSTRINNLSSALGNYQGPSTFTYIGATPQGGSTSGSGSGTGGSLAGTGGGSFGALNNSSGSAESGFRAPTGNETDISDLLGIDDIELNGENIGRAVGTVAGTVFGGPAGGFVGNRIGGYAGAAYDDANAGPGNRPGDYSDIGEFSAGSTTSDLSDNGYGGFSDFSGAFQLAQGADPTEAALTTYGDFGPGYDGFGRRIPEGTRSNVPTLSEYLQDRTPAPTPGAGQSSFQLSRPQAPQFSPTYTYEGQTYSVDTPQLAELNGTQELLDQLSGFSGEIAGLRGEYDTAKGAIDTFRSNTLNSISGLASTVPNLSIADNVGLNNALSQYNTLNSSVSGFANPLLAQLYPDGFTQVNEQLGSLGNTLTGLQGERDSELGRVDAFRQEQRGDAAGILNELETAQLGNVSLDTLNDWRQRLADERSQFLTFDSALNPSFERSQGALQDARGAFGDIESRYNTGQQQIIDERGALRDRVREIQGAADTATPQNLTGLDRFGADIEAVRNRAADFQSPFQTDFSSTLAPLGQLETQLQGLRDTRASDLAGFSDQLSPLAEGIGDIPLQQEDTFNERLSALRELETTAGTYGSSDVSDAIGTAVEGVESRLKELETRRGEIEGNAQGLLGEVEGQNFSDFSTIEVLRERLDAIRSNRETFGAAEAADEIEKIAQQLDAEHSRLGADRDAHNAYLARQRQGTQNQLGPGNSLTFAGQLAGLSPEEYAAFVAARRDDELTQVATISPFARSLGVG